jgi:ADP-ribose pyrophosphatase YjhB (NUDIX family)
VERHFTATAFVVHEGKTLLQWHRKLQQWMPPGGHLLLNEDPATGALREVLEETGLRTAIIPTAPHHTFPYPAQLAVPYAVLLEDIAVHGDGPHQHIDFIFFARSLDGEAVRPPLPDDLLLWVARHDLEANAPLSNGRERVCVPHDVRQLAIAAIDAAE